MNQFSNTRVRPMCMHFYETPWLSLMYLQLETTALKMLDSKLKGQNCD